MFGIGIPELILIAIVALVVVGPKNLPVTLRAVGRAIREFQRASKDLREQAGFDEVVDEVTRPLREGLAGIEKDVMRDEVIEDTSMEYPEAGPDDYGALTEGTGYYPDELDKAAPHNADGTLGPPDVTGVRAGAERAEAERAEAPVATGLATELTTEDAIEPAAAKTAEAGGGVS